MAIARAASAAATRKRFMTVGRYAASLMFQMES